MLQQGVAPEPDREDSRLRILYLYQMLQRESDENHPLSTRQIMEKMEAEHGIRMHRTTLPRDIAVLCAAGIEIITERKHARSYYLSYRPFSLPELRLLIDAVLSSKFITDRKSAALIRKLSSLISRTNAEELRRTVHVTGKWKSENEKGYYIVDAINEAIRRETKLSFYYYDYNNKKKRVRKNDGNPYTVSPYDLIWDGDYYYMTGFCDERGEVRTFRVDRIEKQPRLLDQKAVPKPEDYRVERYTQEVFRMFATQETSEVTLLCQTPAMKSVIDQFGKGVVTEAIGTEWFRATVKVCLSPTFFRWVFGWGGLIRIEGPEDIRKVYCKMLHDEALYYSKLSTQ